MTISHYRRTGFAAVALASLCAGTLLTSSGTAQQTPPAAAPQQTPAPAAPADQTYSVQRTYKEGDVDHYLIKVNTKMTGQQDIDVHMNLHLKETTKSVGKDGQVSILEEYTKADGEFNGMPVDMTPMMPKITVTRDKRGRFDATTEGGNEQVNGQISSMMKQLLQSTSATMPVKPVKVGESWTVDMSAFELETGAKIIVSVKLAGIETINGAKALRLESSSDSTGNKLADTKMHVAGTVLIDAKTGKALKMTSKGSGTVAGNMIDVDTSMEATKGDEPKAAAKDTGPK